MLALQREHFPYTARFCEENIWHLGKRLAAQGIAVANMTAVVLSNTDCTIALLQQRAAPAGQMMVWDYHVILLLVENNEEWILHFDTRLPFVTPRDEYARHSFIPPAHLKVAGQPQLRLIPMEEYLARFSSDRSHMRDASGKPLVPFPAAPIIQPSDAAQAITLMQYIDMAARLPSTSCVVHYATWFVSQDVG